MRRIDESFFQLVSFGYQTANLVLFSTTKKKKRCIVDFVMLILIFSLIGANKCFYSSIFENQAFSYQKYFMANWIQKGSNLVNAFYHYAVVLNYVF